MGRRRRREVSLRSSLDCVVGVQHCNSKHFPEGQVDTSGASQWMLAWL